jgi:hypothetical protein
MNDGNNLNSVFITPCVDTSLLPCINDEYNQHCDRQTDEGPVRHSLSFL